MAERVAIRTCIGCRRRAPRTDLVRHVLVDGPDGTCRVVRDLAASAPGRGAWLCDDAACADRAARRRSWRRALRVPSSRTFSIPEHLPAAATAGLHHRASTD